MNEESRDTTVATHSQHTPITVRPAYRTTETEQGIELEVALPGVRKEDLTVTFHEGILTLVAERTGSVPAGWKLLRAPARPDRYQLRVRLHSSLDPEKTTARLEDGILHLEVFKREEALPRKIEIG